MVMQQQLGPLATSGVGGDLGMLGHHALVGRSPHAAQVIKLMQSFTSLEYVTERFAWRHYYW